MGEKSFNRPPRQRFSKKVQLATVIRPVLSDFQISLPQT
jgi:hypothetical protein